MRPLLGSLCFPPDEQTPNVQAPDPTVMNADDTIRIEGVA